MTTVFPYSYIPGTKVLRGSVTCFFSGVGAPYKHVYSKDFGHAAVEVILAVSEVLYYIRNG